MIRSRPVFPFALALLALSWNIQAWSQVRSFGGAPGFAGASRPSAGAVFSPRPFAPQGGNRGGQHFLRPATPPGQPLFATALGNNVGARVFPGAALYGNVNQPGLPPGIPPAIPNINIPSGLVGGRPINPLLGQGGGGGRRGHSGRGSNVIYVPYYAPVPYAPYYQPDEAEEEAPAPYDPYSQAPPAMAPMIVPVPQWSYPPAPPQAQVPPAPPAPQQAAIPPAPSVPVQRKPKPVTQLAFKDNTVIAVTDYWLEGSNLIYLVAGKPTGIPLEELDFARTVQLNQERNIQISLESKP